MYNHVYQLTHDMDCFFVLNGDATHIATNGGMVPAKLGTVEELRVIQTKVANMERAFGYDLNMDYLSTLQAEDFPSQQELADVGKGENLFESLFENDEYRDIPFHWKVYSHSFVEMARKGFWSFDRVGIMPNGMDVYMLIAWPKYSDRKALLPCVGHEFKLEDCNLWCQCESSRCWPLAEMINMAEERK